MDKFCCSHRCTLDVRPRLGARSCYQHGRVPLDYCLLLLGLLSCPSIYAFAPVIVLLILSDLSHLLFVPNSQADAGNKRFLGTWYRSRPNPLVQSVSRNSQFLRCFRDCVLPPHFDIAHTCVICQVKSKREWAWGQSGLHESISGSAEIERFEVIVVIVRLQRSTLAGPGHGKLENAILRADPSRLTPVRFGFHVRVARASVRLT